MKPGSLLITLAVSLMGAAVPAAAQVFRFNPPDGTTYVETVRVTRENRLGWLGEQNETMESSSRLRITRTDNGFSAEATLLSVRMTEDGKELESPLLVLPIGKTFTYEVDRSGKVRSIRGLNELMNELSAATVAESTDDSFVNVMSDDDLVAGETADWNSRIGSLVGRKFNTGAVWTTTDRLDLPYGRKLTFYTTTRVVGREKRNGHDCVRIRFVSSSNPRAVSSKATRAGARGSRRRPAPTGGAPAAGVSISESGERVVDPVTMLVYAESSTRTVKLKIDALGEENVPTTVIEKREYHYRYE